MFSAPTASQDGVAEFLRKSLEKQDPRSFAYLQTLVETCKSSQPEPFAHCIKVLTGITIAPKEVPYHWKRIIEHKRRMEHKLGRSVHIKTAAVDYYDQAGVSIDPQAADAAEATPMQHAASPSQRSLAERAPSTPANIPAPGYHQERLREEILRARRYKHALSAMMVNVDLHALENGSPDSGSRDKVLGIVDAMITKAIRNVDIRARHSDSQFMLILPNTNKREAQELATRLLKNISARLHRIPELTCEIPLAVAVGQCGPKNDTSAEFIKRLEHLLLSEAGKKPEAVLLLE